MSPFRNACYMRQRFSTEDAARRQIARNIAKGSTADVEPFQCIKCESWHIRRKTNG